MSDVSILVKKIAVVAVVLLLPADFAAASNWTGASANWSSNANPGWNGSGVPNAVGAVANHPAATNATTTVDVAGGVTVGTISLTNNSNNSWQFTITNPITFNQDGSGTGAATLSNTNSTAGTSNFLSLNAGTITLADDLLISNTSSSTNTTGAIQIIGTIGGSGNVTFSNSSTALSQVNSIRLQTATNTFTGNVLVQKGTVTFNKDNSFGNSSNIITLGESGQGSAAILSTTSVIVSNNLAVASGSGGTLTIGSSSISNGTYAGTLALNGDVSLSSASSGSNSLSFSNVISGVGGLAKAGAGSLTLSGNNTFSGDTVLSTGNGTLVLANSNALKNSTLKYTGSTLVFNSSVISHAFTMGGLTGTGDIALQDNAGTPNAVALSIGQNDSSPAAYSGALSGGGSLAKVGLGTLTLTGTNSYSGGTTVSGGTLEGNSTSLQGAITNNSTVTFNQSSDGTYAGAMSGSGSLTKSGSGKLTVSGANTYTGVTSVTGGTLLVDGSLANGGVEVYGGATLGGKGTIGVGGGTVKIGATGTGTGTFSPGASIAVENIVGNLSFGSNGNFAYEINSSVSFASGADLVNVSGDISIDPAANLNFSDLASSPVLLDGSGAKYTLISYAGTLTGTFASKPDNSIVTIGSSSFYLRYNDTSPGQNFSGSTLYSKYVTITAVPEASAFLFGTVASALVSGAYVRRKMVGSRSHAS